MAEFAYLGTGKLNNVALDLALAAESADFFERGQGVVWLNVDSNCTRGVGSGLVGCSNARSSRAGGLHARSGDVVGDRVWGDHVEARQEGTGHRGSRHATSSHGGGSNVGELLVNELLVEGLGVVGLIVEQGGDGESVCRQACLHGRRWIDRVHGRSS